MLLLTFTVAFAQENKQLNVVKNYLDNHGQEYQLLTNDYNDIKVSKEVYSKSTNLTNLYVIQQYQNIEIYNAVSSVALRNNVVFYYANAFISDINSKINTTTAALTAEQAVLNASSHFNLGAPNNLEVVKTEGNTTVFSSANVSREDIPVKLMFYPTNDGRLLLCWDLSLHTLDGKHWWSARVDAQTGAVIDTLDWILSCDFGDPDHANHTHVNRNEASSNSTFSLFKTQSSVVDGSQYRVVALPAESPNHGQIAIVTEPANTTASPYGWHDINGAAGAEYTITRGNNVWVQEDRNANDGVGYSPDGGASLVFDFPYNLNQEPIGYENASLTNLFYMNNMMHDVWYNYGFDEASGNFQENNYGRGGTGGDYVFADGQDGSRLDNATFGTPPEGSNPYMTMYLWSASGLAQPLTVNGGPLAGTYQASVPATGDGNNITGPSTTPVTADLVLVNDPASDPMEEGCGTLSNAVDVNGKIAVILRGDCNFTDKIQNAQDAGAVGVIMTNHNNPTGDANYTPYVNMAGFSAVPFTIPSVFVNYDDGQLLINALKNGDTVNATIVEGGPYQKDGDLDNGIVAHEYGHGISTRLTGGANNSGCLSNNEQMGEGWSDWFALMMTMKPGDLPETGRGIATYSVSQGVDGLGIRPARYSTDFAVNNFTYGATNNAPFNTSVHNVGFVWATVLWDLTWAYVEKYGFSPDLYNGDAGNNKVMQLVIDGLKLQPCNPGMVQGRDALLAADQALTGGEDQCLIWEVFAARGLGVDASQGWEFLMNDQVESFDTPPDTDSSLANCTSLSLNESQFKPFTIYPNPSNGELTIKTTKNYGDVEVSLVDINGRLVMSRKLTITGEVTLDINTLQSGVYVLNIKGQNINVFEKIIKK